MAVATIILGVIALAALSVVLVALPSVVRDWKEWNRRRKLTPFQRATEDFGKAVKNLSDAFATLLAPVVAGAAVAINVLADVLRVDEVGGENR